MAIDFAGCLYLKEDVRRVLIVTVTSGLGVWEDEIAKHFPFSYQILNWHGECLTPWIGKETPTFMVVNFQNVYDRSKTGPRTWTPVARASLVKYKPELIIVDESHHIGNPTAEQSKQIYALAKNARFKVIMTGTMFDRKPFFAFGQIKFLDDGRTFGTAFGNFKKRIAVFGGFQGYEVLRYRNLPWMMREIKKQVFIEQHPELHHPVTNILHFDLTGKGSEKYDEMETDSITWVEGEPLLSPLVLTRHLRLSQIEGGYVKMPSGKYVLVGTDKLDLAEDRLREYIAQDINKVVIGCRFLPELVGVGQRAKRAGYKVILFHGKVPPGKERSKRIRAFNEAEEPTVFISQIATGSQAIDLSVADTMMLYSLSESYLLHNQFTRRIEKFEERRTLQYDYLLGRGCRGEVTYAALMEKKDVATYIAEKPRLVEKLTRRG